MNAKAGAVAPQDKLWVLATDVRMIPLGELNPAVTRRISRPASLARREHLVVYRPMSRSDPKMIDRSVERVLAKFKRPATFLDVVIATLHEDGGRPVPLLRRLQPLVARLVRDGILVRADRPGDGNIREIKPLLKAGETFAGCRIVAPIRATIDSEVYLAVAGRGRRCALKMSRPCSTDAAVRRVERQMRREFEILRGLDGTAAACAVASGRRDGRQYGLVEWIDGQDVDEHAARLRGLVDGDSDARRRLAELACRCLDAVGTIHTRGYLHGDIHAKNLLVDGDAVRVIDFGLAGALEGGRTRRMSFAGVVHFLPPEAALAMLKDERRYDRSIRSEVYAMGVLVYRLLTGRHYLRPAYSRRAVARAIARSPMRSFREAGAPPWPAVEAVLRQALSKEPRERFPSLTRFRQALAVAAVLPVGPASVRGTRKSPGARRLARLKAFADYGLEKLASCRYDLLALEQAPPYASVAYGGGGAAFILLKAAGLYDAADMLAQAAAWTDLALADVSSPTGLYAPGAELTPDRIRPGSVYYSEAGLRVVQALIADAMDAESVRNAALARLAELMETARRGPSDLFFGPPGWLAAVSVLSREIVDERLTRWESRLARVVQDRVEASVASSQAPWDARGYLGAAHGRAGVLFPLLQWGVLRGARLPDDVHGLVRSLIREGVPTISGLNWPMRAGEPRKSMTSLCHGAPGVGMTLARAYEYFGDREFLEAARGAARHVASVEDEYASLCCGSTGQAYGLLSVARVDPDGPWFDSAVELALRAADPKRLAGQACGLLKGWAGPVCLALDLTAKERPRCPLLEA